MTYQETLGYGGLFVTKFDAILICPIIDWLQGGATLRAGVREVLLEILRNSEVYIIAQVLFFSASYSVFFTLSHPKLVLLLCLCPLPCNAVPKAEQASFKAE